MRVKILYFGQLYTVTKKKSEDIEIAEDITLRSLLIDRASIYGDSFRTMVFDNDFNLRPSIIIVLNDKMAAKDKEVELQDGDEIKLLTAIAGG